jgi:hypothetical protein
VCKKESEGNMSKVYAIWFAEDDDRDTPINLYTLCTSKKKVNLILKQIENKYISGYYTYVSVERII